MQHDLNTVPTRLELRAAIGETLSGDGIEFGPGANPFPVAASSRVRYADRNSTAELKDREYFGDSVLVADDIDADFESMVGIPLESFDFIIASHVIEHTSNPLRALQCAHERLRPGGRLVLVVPDKIVTFDRDRPITSLEHFLADYTRPSRERDWEHYIEFFSKCFPQPDPVKAAEPVFARGDDIHYHVWTYESFAELIEYTSQHIVAWSAVWSRKRISDDDNEFYFILTK